jgi:hypothetical protein
VAAAGADSAQLGRMVATRGLAFCYQQAICKWLTNQRLLLTLPEHLFEVITLLIVLPIWYLAYDFFATIPLSRYVCL